MLDMFSFKSIQYHATLRQVIEERVADPDLAQSENEDGSLCQARMVM